MKIIETKFGTYMERENDPTKLTGDKIKVFVERLKKIGIEAKNLVNKNYHNTLQSSVIFKYAF